VPVDRLRPTTEYTTVYNFRVADYHTYFVGDDAWAFAVWAHNSYGDDLQDMNLKGWKKGKGSSPSHAVHAAEMGYESVAEYTNAAKEFAAASGKGFTTAKIGNTFFKYDHGTERILIVNGKDRVIKTFYKAENGTTSFKEAMQAHIAVLRAQGHDI